ncbi:MAG: hypothetical protein Q9173_004349 [Seirophora scorigena]
MDSHGSIPFSWPNDETAYDQQIHGLLGGSSQIPSSSAAFRASYQTPFAPDMVHEAEPNNNVSMGNYETGPQPGLFIHEAQRDGRSSRRARSGHLDWSAHKDTIKELYLDQNMTLAQTMKAMNEQYSFDASVKLYKTKFKEWNWSKNRSADTARKMVEKSKRRKREGNKDTVFLYGGREVESHRLESTLARTKKPKVAIDLTAFNPYLLTNIPTPEGVSYKTPKALVESPAESVVEVLDMQGLDMQDSRLEESSDDATDVGALGQGKFALRWQGHSRTDLQEMWPTALRFRDAGNFDEAENLLSRAVTGLSHVLGKTNVDTVKAAHNLADLSAESGRMEHAMDLLQKVMQVHLETYGRRDARTHQNILHAVELLNGWNREADALGLPSLSKELLLESSPSTRNTSKARNTEKGKAHQKSTGDGSQSELSGVTQSVLEDSGPSLIDDGLGVARSHIAIKDQSTEGLLLAIISQCERNPTLCLKRLKALAELLGLYGKLGQAMDRGAGFHFDLMEAGLQLQLQLVAHALKHGHLEEAKIMFRKAYEKSSAVFGWEDERTVWLNITIGLVYQTRMTWDDATEWFEEALAAALAWDRPKDGIVRLLEKALSQQHFSYVSDEGRPYKTSFGVSGLVVEPGRLHLE